MQIETVPVKRVQPSSDLTLRDLVAPLFRRRRTVLLTLPVVFAVVVLLGLSRTHSYESRMAILVNQERVDPLITPQAGPEMITTNNAVSDAEINSEVKLLTSSDVLEHVVVSTGLADKHGFRLADLVRPNETNENRVARAVRNLTKALKVAPAIKTDIIEVSYASSDPQLSYKVVRTLGELYMQKHVAVHRPPGSYDFFSQETDRYQKALQDSEARLRDFVQKEGIAAPDLVRTDLALQLTNFIGQWHSAQQAIASDEQRIASDRRQMAITPQRSATQQATSPADRLAQDLHATLLAAETKRTQLALKYDPGYPLVQEADQEIAQAKSALADAVQTQYVTQTTDRDPAYELLREDLLKTRADLAGQNATLVAARRSTESLQAQMVDLDHNSLIQQDLLRAAKANEANYLLYLSKREEARTSDALDKTRIANVAIATPADVPVLPTTSLPFLLSVAFCAAIVLSVGTGYAADYLDSTFQLPSQVVESLNIPVVISMPKRTA